MTSNRIGRNERCPCGSGKKFKKCCISNYDQKLKRSDDILEGGKVDRIAGMRAIIKETSNHCRERFDWVNAKHDAEKIRIAIEEIESSARKLLSIPYHSKRYWYILIRRYTWLLWDEYKQETDKSSSKSKYEISVRAGKLILLSTDDEEPFELVETNGTSGVTTHPIIPKSNKKTLTGFRVIKITLA